MANQYLISVLSGDFAMSASMVNQGTLTIVDPYIPQRYALQHQDGSGKAITKGWLQLNGVDINDPLATFPYFPHELTSQVSGSYTFNIVQVLSSTDIVVEEPEYSWATLFLYPNVYQNLRTIYGPPTGEYTLMDSPTSDGFSAITNFTASYVQPSAVIPTERSQSFARIILNNLEPATGDVFAIRSAYKPGGAYGDYRDLGITNLEQVEQLITGSQTTAINPIIGATDPSTGFFINTPDITNSWELSAHGAGIGTPSIIYDPTTLIGAAKISADTSTPTVFSDTNAIIFKLKDDAAIDNGGHQPTLSQGTEYILKFNHYVSSSAFPGTIADHRADIYVSGALITTDIQNDLNAQYMGSDFQPINGLFGTRVGTLSNLTEGYNVTTDQLYFDRDFVFRADESKPISLYFVIRGGEWQFSDISLKTNKQTGFNPNFTRIDLRVPSEHLNIPLSFKFEYLDYQYRAANYVTYVTNVTMSGNNTYIQGGNNLLTGSMYLSNELGSGMQMSGENSGFIRSVGYNGFTSASAGSGSGFLMFSGSVLPSVTDDYSDGGVGLELVQDSGSYFRFRTAGPNAGLEVVTDKFFLGNTNNQFISGSGGQLEISSSNFHLTADGNVTASNALFNGVALANIIRDKTVTVDSGNSSLYTSSAAGNTTLYFDGSQGGEQIRSMLIDTDITDPINNMVAPAIGTAKIELIIEIGSGRTVQITDSAFSGPVGPK
jgi:hypothetical protein